MPHSASNWDAPSHNCNITVPNADKNTVWWFTNRKLQIFGFIDQGGDLKSMCDWYVLAVHPRKEHFVSQQLGTLGYSVACPTFKKSIRHARKQEFAERPLFPGYLFVRLEDGKQMWRQVNSIPGSIGIVKFGNRPVPLKKSFAHQLVSGLNSDGSLKLSAELRSGDKVLTVGGVFDKLIGEVVQLSSDERVKILMSAFNRKVEMTLPKAAVLVAV